MVAHDRSAQELGQFLPIRTSYPVNNIPGRTRRFMDVDLLSLFGRDVDQPLNNFNSTPFLEPYFDV